MCVAGVGGVGVPLAVVWPVVGGVAPYLFLLAAGSYLFFFVCWRSLLASFSLAVVVYLFRLSLSSVVGVFTVVVLPMVLVFPPLSASLTPLLSISMTIKNGI